jgi:hypothetical protein
VNVVSNSGVQIAGDKVVFGSWVGFDDVSSLSSDIQVEDSVQARNSRWSWRNVEDIRSVLEGSSELSGILSQLDSDVGLRNSAVLGNNGSFSVVGIVNESSVGSRHGWVSRFDGRNVVSQSQDTVAVIGIQAR